MVFLCSLPVFTTKRKLSNPGDVICQSSPCANGIWIGVATLDCQPSTPSAIQFALTVGQDCFFVNTFVNCWHRECWLHLFWHKDFIFNSKIRILNFTWSDLQFWISSHNRISLLDTNIWLSPLQANNNWINLSIYWHVLSSGIPVVRPHSESCDLVRSGWPSVKWLNMSQLPAGNPLGNL